MSQNGPAASSLYLIVGLGNPGPKYANTRHNVGFMVLDELARRAGLRFSSRQANAEVARGQVAGKGVILAKPMTYMNNSGQAVGALARFYKVPAEQVLVVYDDFDLPLGSLRIREKGSGGTHNGVNDIVRHLGTQGFPRLRVGVDRPVVAQQSHINWVLGRFTKEEQQVMEETIPRACDAIETLLREGTARAMNEFNSRSPGKNEPAEDAGKPAEPAHTVPQAAEPAAPKTNRWVDKLRRLHGGEDAKG